MRQAINSNASGKQTELLSQIKINNDNLASLEENLAMAYEDALTSRSAATELEEALQVC
jgi:hypothetical protein